jgi:hypothetical protein
VSYFTLRISIILMERIKDLYISVGQVPLDGTLGRGSRFGADMRLFSGEGAMEPSPALPACFMGEGVAFRKASGLSLIPVHSNGDDHE